MMLVTGASGFIGRHLIAMLKQEQISHEILHGDIVDRENLPKTTINTIIHLASIITHRGEDDEDALQKVNIGGTRNLIEAYPKAKVIFISTTDVTREHLEIYAQTKLEAENMVSENNNNLIIRLPSVFGAGTRQKKLIPLLFEHYLYERKCIISNNDEREYLYVIECIRNIIAFRNRSGLITLKGHKVRNYDLDIMIKTLCDNPESSCPFSEHSGMYQQLYDTMQKQYLIK